MTIKVELPKIRGYLQSEAQALLDFAVERGWVSPYGDAYLMRGRRGDIGMSRSQALRWAVSTVPKINRLMSRGILQQNDDGTFNVQRGARGMNKTIGEVTRMVDGIAPRRP